MSDLEYRLMKIITICITVVMMASIGGCHLDKWNEARMSGLFSDPIAQRLWAVKEYIAVVDQKDRATVIMCISTNGAMPMPIFEAMPVEVQKAALKAQAITGANGSIFGVPLEKTNAPFANMKH